MAIYIPPSTRRRRLVALVAAGVLVGAIAGFAIGRASSTGLDEALADVRDQAEEVAVSLQRIPIEYEQALDGTGRESAETITAAIASAREQLAEAWDEASWLGASVRAPVEDALAAVSDAAARRAPVATFQAAVDDVVTALTETFGLDRGSPSGAG